MCIYFNKLKKKKEAHNRRGIKIFSLTEAVWWTKRLSVCRISASAQTNCLGNEPGLGNHLAGTSHSI